MLCCTKYIFNPELPRGVEYHVGQLLLGRQVLPPEFVPWSQLRVAAGNTVTSFNAFR